MWFSDVVNLCTPYTEVARLRAEHAAAMEALRAGGRAEAEAAREDAARCTTKVGRRCKLDPS